MELERSIRKTTIWRVPKKGWMSKMVTSLDHTRGEAQESHSVKVGMGCRRKRRSGPKRRRGKRAGRVGEEQGDGLTEAQQAVVIRSLDVGGAHIGEAVAVREARASELDRRA
jgi:hypothetical protein